MGRFRVERGARGDKVITFAPFEEGAADEASLTTLEASCFDVDDTEDMGIDDEVEEGAFACDCHDIAPQVRGENSQKDFTR